MTKLQRQQLLSLSNDHYYDGIATHSTAPLALAFSTVLPISLWQRQFSRDFGVPAIAEGACLSDLSSPSGGSVVEQVATVCVDTRGGCAFVGGPPYFAE